MNIRSVYPPIGLKDNLNEESQFTRSGYLSQHFDVAANQDDIPMATETLARALQDKMGVMFLRSSAKNLGMALTEIFQSVEQFPDCAFEISTDNSAQQLVAQLSSIQVVESAAGFAKRLSFEGANGNSPFASSAIRGKSLSPASRAKLKAPISTPASQDQAQRSNALFLLRSVKQ